MSDISYRYLRSITGPQLQVTGTNVTRYPTLNIGDTLELTEDIINRRHTLELNTELSSSLTNLTLLSSSYVSYDFTGSVTYSGNTVKTITSAVPKYAYAGIISASTTQSLEISLSTEPDEPFVDWVASGHVISSGSTIWREVQFGLVDNKTAAAAMAYTGSQGNFFPNISCSMSSSVNSALNMFSIHLVNSTANQYSFTINLGISKVSSSADF